MKLFQDGKEVSTINFGEVEFGIKKEIIIEVLNDSAGKLTELEFKTNPDIQITNAPQMIPPQSSAYVTLGWMPNATVQQPINVNLEISGKEVFGE